MTYSIKQLSVWGFAGLLICFLTLPTACTWKVTENVPERSDVASEVPLEAPTGEGVTEVTPYAPPSDAPPSERTEPDETPPEGTTPDATTPDGTAPDSEVDTDGDGVPDDEEPVTGGPLTDDLIVEGPEVDLGPSFRLPPPDARVDANASATRVAYHLLGGVQNLYIAGNTSVRSICDGAAPTINVTDVFLWRSELPALGTRNHCMPLGEPEEGVQNEVVEVLPTSSGIYVAYNEIRGHGPDMTKNGRLAKLVGGALSWTIDVAVERTCYQNTEVTGLAISPADRTSENPTLHVVGNFEHLQRDADDVCTTGSPLKHFFIRGIADLPSGREDLGTIIGSTVSSESIDLPEDSEVVANDIAVDSDGNIIVTGYTTNGRPFGAPDVRPPADKPGGQRQLFVAFYDSEKNIKVVRHIGNALFEDRGTDDLPRTVGQSIYLSGDQEIWVGGWSQPTLKTYYPRAFFYQFGPPRPSRNTHGLLVKLNYDPSAISSTSTDIINSTTLNFLFEFNFGRGTGSRVTSIVGKAAGDHRETLYVGGNVDSRVDTERTEYGFIFPIVDQSGVPFEFPLSAPLTFQFGSLNTTVYDMALGPDNLLHVVGKARRAEDHTYLPFLINYDTSSISAATPTVTPTLQIDLSER